MVYKGIYMNSLKHFISNEILNAKFTLALSLWFCLLLAPVLSFAGGWVSGGGEGLACWSTRMLAAGALDQEGRLTEVARHSMTSLEMVDIEEMALSFSRPVAGESVDAFMQRLLLEKSKVTGPYFAETLALALSKVGGPSGERKWRDRPEGLVKIHDEGFRLKLSSPLCRFVQVAHRFEKRSAGQETEVRIEYDRDLYEKLYSLVEKIDPKWGIFNQAVLRLHEAFYLIRTEMGYHDSDSSRQMLRFWLRAEAGAGAGAGPGTSCDDPNICLIAKMIFNIGSTMVGFNEYPVAFESSSQALVPAFSYLSRRQAFASKAHKALQIRQSDPLSNEIGWSINFALDKVQKTKFANAYFPKLNSEENFLEFAEQAYFDQVSPYMVDAFLVSEDSNAIHWVCKLAEINRKLSPSTMIQGASHYCRDAARLK